MLQASRRTETPAASLPALKVSGIQGLVSRLFVVLAWLLFVLVAWRALVHVNERTAIQAVLVEGELRNVSSRLLAERVAPYAQGNYFSVDLLAIQQAARAVPWVDEVVVSRRWPDGVRIQVRERQPVALWGAGGLISSRGDLFVPGSAVSATDLPILFGPSGKTLYVMEQYRAMNSILRGLGMRIVELQLTDRMSWFLRMDNGIQLVVDQVETIEKMQRFAYLFEHQLKPDVANIASVDLRYRNGVAIGWKISKVAVPAA